MFCTDLNESDNFCQGLVFPIVLGRREGGIEEGKPSICDKRSSVSLKSVQNTPGKCNFVAFFKYPLCSLAQETVSQEKANAVTFQAGFIPNKYSVLVGHFNHRNQLVYTEGS